MHKSSLDKMEKFVDNYLDKNKKLKILDIGSQDVSEEGFYGSYRHLFNSELWEYTGVDLCEGKNVDVVLKDVYRWREFDSSSFDVVISGQAIEHIEFFWVTMYEVARVLKPNGISCIIGPSGGYEHRYPIDCWRFYPDGFNALATYAYLEPVEVYTQWETLGYNDGSDDWHDSVMIAKKPKFRFIDNIILTVKRNIQYIMLPRSYRS
jgi:SAM-dependent methyltransferase